MNPLSPVLHYLVNILKALGGQLAAKTVDFLKQFVKEDVGKLALDVIKVVEAEMPDADGVAKRDAAVKLLKADLATAGHDVESFALSTLNWLVESALQAVVTGAVK